MAHRAGDTGRIGALRLRWPLPSGAATSAQGDRRDRVAMRRTLCGHGSSPRKARLRCGNIAGALIDGVVSAITLCDNYAEKKRRSLHGPWMTCYKFGGSESEASTGSPESPLLSERGCVRQLNSSSRCRISSPHVARALQCSQSGLCILRRANR
jgi:hypothetical protein